MTNTEICTEFKKYEESKAISADHVATPRYVVEQIYSLIHIEQFKMCWFPFNHYDSQFKLKADELNLKYKATHIFDDLGNDFFKTEPPKDCELMISNPPFSLQNEILKHSFELVDIGKVKSFALLLPLATLATAPRAEMFAKHVEGLKVIVIKKRIKFIGFKSSFNRDLCWLCYKIPGLPVLSWI